MCPRSPGRLTRGTGRQLVCGIHSDCCSRLSIKAVYVGILFSPLAVMQTITEGADW